MQMIYNPHEENKGCVTAVRIGKTLENKLKEQYFMLVS